MNLVMGAGTALSLLGVGGYVFGVWIAYPGRSLSVTVLMLGIALIATGRSIGSGGPQ